MRHDAVRASEVADADAGMPATPPPGRYATAHVTSCEAAEHSANDLLSPVKAAEHSAVMVPEPR
jgi:hypothetical protein